MAQTKAVTKPIPPHKILREVYRHYLEFRDLVANHGMDTIEHSYVIHDEEGTPTSEKINITISFWDLHYGLKDLSPRKREAVFHNVILDKKQKEVAAIMGITTVSVGQYVEQSMIQLSERYFAELSNEKYLADVEKL